MKICHKIILISHDIYLLHYHIRFFENVFCYFIFRLVFMFIAHVNELLNTNLSDELSTIITWKQSHIYSTIRDVYCSFIQENIIFSVANYVMKERINSISVLQSIPPICISVFIYYYIKYLGRINVYCHFNYYCICYTCIAKSILNTKFKFNCMLTK